MLFKKTDFKNFKKENLIKDYQEFSLTPKINNTRDIIAQEHMQVNLCVQFIACAKS